MHGFGRRVTGAGPAPPASPAGVDSGSPRLSGPAASRSATPTSVTTARGGLGHALGEGPRLTAVCFARGPRLVHRSLFLGSGPGRVLVNPDLLGPHVHIDPVLRQRDDDRGEDVV